MGTRAIFRFTDHYGDDKYVYSHWDGYPSGAAQYVENTLASGKIFDLPRFEADEFAAGFIAANKTSDGCFRVSDAWRYEPETWIEYVYEVRQLNRDGPITVSAFAVYKGLQTLFSCSLEEFPKSARSFHQDSEQIDH